MRLTDKNVHALPGPPPGRPHVIHYDEELKGFGLRCTHAGARSFILNFYVNGTERRITIGSAGSMKAATARDEAKKLKAEAALGHDPMQARHSLRQSSTMKELAHRYIEEWAKPKKRPSSLVNDRTLLDRHILPTIGARRVNSISYSDVATLHRRVTKTAPVTANRCVALLSKMFALAIRWGYCEANPARGIQRNAEERREVYLDSAALGRLSAALAEFPRSQSADVIRLLLLTGARRGEVLGATWGMFDLEQGIWRKPSSSTKQKRPHTIPLSKPALTLLQDLHEERGDGPFIFPGTNRGAQSDLKHFWKSVSTRAGLEGVRIHDLRHSFASILANSGLSLPVIGQMLGHSNPSTTARYAHISDQTLRAAAAIAGKAWAVANKTGKAVSLRGGKSRG